MRVVLCVLLVLWGCGGETTSQWQPELFCPNATTGQCDAVKGATLRAGVARRSVNPSCFEVYDDLNGNDKKESEEPFWDCGCDRVCPGDAGYVAPDEGEGDGQFQAIWLAGFQQARAAKGVRGADRGLIGDTDGLMATATVLEQGNTRLAIVSVDGFGWMYEEVSDIRQQLAQGGAEIDHLMLHSTHSHATPDTLGIYGKSITSTGFNEAYAAQFRDTVVEVVEAAAVTLHPVAMRVGRIDLSTTSEQGILNYMSDTRDPFVVDPWLGAAHFYRVDTNAPVVTLVNWASHPEATSDSDSLMSADFVHGIRTAIEQGYEWDTETIEPLGGLVVYLNGALGGMMTPLRIENEDPDGVRRKDHSFEKADAIGLQVGHHAMTALREGTEVAAPALSFRTQRLFLPIDNQAFQAMFLIGVLQREAYNYNPDDVLSDVNIPEIQTELNLIDIGPVRMLTFPGEVLPELTIGGYGGEHIHAEGVPLIQPDNPNPPRLENAPSGPYWKDILDAEHAWIVGLANDQLGYIIPPYNYILHDTAPYVFEAEGDHYEETNSLGPRTAPLLDDVVQQLVGWSPE